MFLLVSKFKIRGMLLNVVHCQVRKANKKIKQESLTDFITIPLFNNYVQIGGGIFLPF